MGLLLVEDNTVNQMIAASLLEGDGYAVAIAGDGLEALDMAARDRFDAILMDIQLPYLDGVEATRRLRTGDGPNRETPIIALTANARADDRARYLAAGMNDCLPKPFDLDVVRVVMARWIGAEMAAEAASASGGGAR